MDPGFVVIAVIFFVIAILASIFGYLAAKKRREELARFAASRGWTYVAEEDRLIDRFSGAPFSRGFGRRAYNVLYGKHDGRDLVSFDYHYKTQSSNGKTTTTHVHRFSVLALSLGPVAMPALTVDPEGLFDRVVDAIAGNDIDLESEDFNRAFTVTCPDRKFASDVLHPQMMEFLLQHPDLGWRFERDSMLMVDGGQRSLAEIDGTLVLMDAIVDRIPEFVWAQLRGHG